MQSMSRDLANALKMPAYPQTINTTHTTNSITLFELGANDRQVFGEVGVLAAFI